MHDTFLLDLKQTLESCISELDSMRNLTTIITYIQAEIQSVFLSCKQLDKNML